MLYARLSLTMEWFGIFYAAVDWQTLSHATSM